MPGENPLAEVAHVIQLSVAPVFLLTGIATTLGVLGTRLGRIVDRFRVLNDRADGLGGDRLARLQAEQDLLRRRRKLINFAIACGTGAALTVALVIISAFLGFIYGWQVSWVVAKLFIGALALFMTAMVFFLREVLLAGTTADVEHR